MPAEANPVRYSSSCVLSEGVSFEVLVKKLRLRSADPGFVIAVQTRIGRRADKTIRDMCDDGWSHDLFGKRKERLTALFPDATCRSRQLHIHHAADLVHRLIDEAGPGVRIVGRVAVFDRFAVFPHHCLLLGR